MVVMGGSEVFVEPTRYADMSGRLDQGKIAQDKAMLDAALGQLLQNNKNPSFSVLMNHPGKDAEAVLNMLALMKPSQVIIFYNQRKGERIGIGWNKAGPVTPVAVDSRNLNLRMTNVRRAHQELLVASWTQDIGAKDAGIYSILAEISRISDAGLKDLALMAVRYALLKYVSLEPAKQKQIMLKPELIKNELEQSGVMKFIKITSDGRLYLAIQEMVDNYQAQVSVKTAA